MPPATELFSSFDDAWRWFASGGALVPIDEQRARFTAGRAQLLAFQAPIADAAVIALAQQVHDALAGIDALLPLPDDLLHCSLRAAGFQVIAKQRPDDVLRQDVGRIAERAASAIRPCAPVDVTVGPVNVFPDALILEMHDGGALAGLRRALAAATSHDAFVGDDAHYLPHISLAFFEDAGPADALRDRLLALRALPPVPTTIA
ncbi:MAG TPA: 2'-5' RNA ligase family protein, partial [Gemmatimonadales bacterium]|nr:2'-5' RNA ligase family protein [Gemmatimonadales bacterium]